MSFALALLAASEEGGKVPVMVGIVDLNNAFDTATCAAYGPLTLSPLPPEPIENEDLTPLELEALRFGADYKGDWEFLNFMRLIGRRRDGIPGIPF